MMDDLERLTVVVNCQNAKRFEQLARVFKTEAHLLADRVFEHGLYFFEKAMSLPGLPNIPHLLETIERYWQTESDLVIATRLKCCCSTVTKYRIALNLIKPRGNKLGAHNGPKRKALGSKKDVEYALSKGGQTIQDLSQKKGLNCSKERVRQIIAEYGLTGAVSKRTLQWYANRLLGTGKDALAKKMAQKDWVLAQITKYGDAYSWAGTLDISEGSLENFLREYHGITHKGRAIRHRENGDREMMDLICSNPECRKPFRRPKSLIDSRLKSHPHQKFFFDSRKCQGHFLGIGGYKK